MQGKGVSNGIGLGKIVILNNEEIKPEKIKVENTKKEIETFKKALYDVIEEVNKLLSRISGTEKEIMEAYLMILEDQILADETINVIKEEKCNAEYGVEMGFDKIIKMFEQIDDNYMASRSSDIKDMKEKVLSKILKKETVNLSKLPENTIIATKELKTSDTAKLDLKNVVGIITEMGGINSHMSIMARNHDIPAIVGVKDLLSNINNNDFVAINGETGEIVVNPTKEECIKLEEMKQAVAKEKDELEKYKDKETVTLDGHSVQIFANIGIPQDVESAIENSAEGVGLFRTEFLYMNSNTCPTEEEQFEAYKSVAENLKGKRAVIRTLDIGGDKNIKYMNLPEEQNPFLGYRAIRICLDDVSLFKTQLRAILRASNYGNLAIMLPMISSVEELREAKSIIQEVKDELKNKNIKFDENIEVGIMIEIPSAALMAESLAKECDFFSIGTNDLIQYTVAVERGNEKIEKLYSKYHPAVIKLIKLAIDGAHKNSIHCGMCGEAASRPAFIPLLIGLGLDEFSMNCNKILNARMMIRNLNYEDCKKLAEKTLTLESSTDIEMFLKKDLMILGTEEKIITFN